MSNKNDKEEGKISDFIKKISDHGLKSALLNEDVLKEIIKEIPLPKAVVSGLIGQIKNSKDEILQSIRDELKKYLSNLDTHRIIDYILENYDVDVQASVKFKKKKVHRRLH